MTAARRSQQTTMKRAHMSLGRPGPAQSRTTVADLVDAGVLTAGDDLFFASARVTVTQDGQLQADDGRRFTSPTDAATVLSGSIRNGWECWRLGSPGRDQDQGAPKASTSEVARVPGAAGPRARGSSRPPGRAPAAGRPARAEAGGPASAAELPHPERQPEPPPAQRGAGPCGAWSLHGGRDSVGARCRRPLVRRRRAPSVDDDRLTTRQ